MRISKLSTAALVVVIHLISSQHAYAYLDPGTGSYIFQVAIAAIIGGLFTIKTYWQKIQNVVVPFVDLFHI